MTSFLSNWVSVEDLFLAGIGCDITGAVLLAMSATGRLRDLVDQSASRWGWSPPLLIARARDRIRGRTAIAVLIVGFVAQAVGYLLQLATEHPYRPGWGVVGGGAISLASGIALGVLLDVLVQRSRLKPSLVQIACCRPDQEPLVLPPINKLEALASTKWPRRPEENSRAYVERIFRQVKVGPAEND